MAQTDTNGDKPRIKGFQNTYVRFFIYDEELYNEFDDTHGDIRECDEAEFLTMPKDWPIQYERHTTFQSGVSQICLTRSPAF